MPEGPELEATELHETLAELREERREEEEAEAWLKWVSVSTAAFAVVAALASLFAGSLVNEALQKKNDSVLRQTQASDQWAYYQAKGLKSNGAAQTAAVLTAVGAGPAIVAKWRAEAGRYKAEQEAITAAARRLEGERDTLDHEAERLEHRHHTFAYAVTLTQIAIALAAIAALTRRKNVWIGSIALGLAGVALFALGFVAPRAGPESPAHAPVQTPPSGRAGRQSSPG